MSSLRREIRQVLQQFLDEHENEETPAELLRIVQEEAGLLQETERAKDALHLDPFECLKQLKPSSFDRMLQLLQITECHRVHTKSGYCNIKATCRINADARMKTRGVAQCMELNFHYERQGDPSIDKHHHPNEMLVPSVLYSIDLSRDHGPSEKMLWVHVYAPENKPPPHNAPAINMMEEGDEWEDMDEDEVAAAVTCDKGDRKAEVSLGKRNRDATMPKTKEDQPQQQQQQQRNDSNYNEMKSCASSNGNDDEEMVVGENVVRFLAGMDPDVLNHFLQWSHLAAEMEDDLASFYLVMTFPFYEFEFDLLGYLLEGIFGKQEGGDSGSDHE